MPSSGVISASCSSISWVQTRAAGLQSRLIRAQYNAAGFVFVSQEAPSRGHRRPGVGPTCDVVGRARPLPLPPVVRSDDRFCTSTGPSGRVFTSCSGARALGGSSSCGRCGVPRWYGYGRLDEGGTHHRRARQRELNGWGRCVHRVPLLMSSPDLGSAGYVPEATW